MSGPKFEMGVRHKDDGKLQIVRINGQAHEVLKAYAKKRGRSMSEVMTALVVEYLAEVK